MLKDLIIVELYWFIRPFHVACKSGAEPGLAGQGGDSCERRTEAIVIVVSHSASLGIF